jgi:hypothetical protein
MKITTNKIVAAVFTGLGIVILVIASTSRGRAQNKVPPSAPIANEKESAAKTDIASRAAPEAATVAAVKPAPPAPPTDAGAPFIIKDTDSDSPGTNIVTRIVTITAEVGGEPPIALQWKVDKGSGFVDIPGATSATYRIGNAQVPDSGLYSLFATNSLGGISTTPVPLIVTEGED